MKKIFIMIFFLLNSSVLAATPSISLPQYYQAKCADYAGNWQGFMTDPTDLFADGGPWPVKLELSEANGVLYGSTQLANIFVANTMYKNKLFAHCTNGKLQNIFWGKKGKCGGLSQQGMLVSKNVMVLQLHWENAMTGTDFLLFLKRKASSNTATEANRPPTIDPATIKTCH